MKIKHLFLPLLVLAVVSFGCNKDSDDEPEKLDPEGDCFTAYIDGEFFNSDNVLGTEVLGLTISATFGTTNLQTFGFNLFNTNVGTYTFTPQTGTEATAQYSEGSLLSPDIYFSDGGTITITEHDEAGKRIKGTFSFEGINTIDQTMTIEVTDGIFDLGYN